MMIEHVDAIVDMRRFVALEKGGLPANAQGVLENYATPIQSAALRWRTGRIGQLI